MNELWREKVARRRFLAASAAASAGLAGLAIAGCGDDDVDDQQPSDDTDPSDEGTALPEGELIVAVPSLFDENFIVPLGSDNENKPYLDTVYDYLIYLKTTSWELLPGLAESWDVADDGLEWTFQIRSGVPFHGDRGEVTAEDVKFTLELLAGEESLAVIAENLRVRVSEMVADGQQLTLRLSEPWVDLEYELSSFSGYPIVSKAYVEEVGVDQANQEPVGSGPYQLVEHIPGDRMVFEALEEHWRVVPEFARLVVRAVPEEATRVSMLQAGEADIAPISLTSVENIGGSSELRIVELPDANTSVVVLGGLFLEDSPNYDPEVPWTRLEVRQALNLAVDREAIVEGVFRGLARPAAAPILIFPGYEDKEPYPYDPDAARELLATAGYPDGFDLRMLVIDWPASSAAMSDFAQAIAGYFEEIGVTVTLEPSDLGAFVPNLREATTTGYSWTEAVGPYAEYSGIGNAMFHSGNPHPIFWSEELDALWAELAETVDPEERTDIYNRITDYLYEQYPVVSVVHGSQAIGVSGKVGEWTPIRGRFLNYWDYATHEPPLGTFREFEVFD